MTIPLMTLPTSTMGKNLYAGYRVAPAAMPTMSKKGLGMSATMKMTSQPRFSIHDWKVG